MALIETPGRYAVSVTDLEFGESAKGNQRITLFFKTEDGLAIAGDLYLGTIQEIEHPGSADTGKDGLTNLQRTNKVLKATFGFDGDYTTAAATLKGKPASIEVAEETYNGKTRCKVAFISAPRVEMANKGAFLSALSKASKLAPAPAPTAKPAPKTAPAGNDADVPF